MSISQNFPAISPTLNLNFARSKKLDPRITFTRTSSATRTNAQGLIEVVSTDTPRFEHSYNSSTGSVNSLGLLIEESRTNLLLQSTTPDNLVSPWGKGINTTRVGVTTAPNGTNTAVYYSGDGSGANEFVNQTVNLLANTTYTVSVWVKLISGSVPTSGNIISAEYNNGTGLVRANVSFNGNLTTEWKRFSTTYTNINATSASKYFTADQNNTAQIAIWGAQVETGAFPTSYIPTVASTVTRSADNASMTGTNFTSWYNSSEGTLFAAARINALGGGTYPGIVYVDDGTVSNCIGFYINDAGSDTIGAEAYISNVAQYGLSSSATTANQLNKVISAYKVNDFAATFNIGSNTVQTDTSGSIPTVNRLIIGLLRGSNAPLNGTISQLLYYPKRLTNSQLQNLTK